MIVRTSASFCGILELNESHSSSMNCCLHSQHTADLYFRRFWPRTKCNWNISAIPFSYRTFHGLNSQWGAWGCQLLSALLPSSWSLLQISSFDPFLPRQIDTFWICCNLSLREMKPYCFYSVLPLSFCRLDCGGSHLKAMAGGSIMSSRLAWIKWGRVSKQHQSNGGRRIKYSWNKKETHTHTNGRAN